MGIIRKTISASTLGAVDFRSDKERIARYSRQTRNAVRAGNEAAARADYGATHPPIAPPTYQAGWFVDEHDPRFLRWWNPTGPSEHVQLIPDGPPMQIPPPGQAALPVAVAGLGDELARLAQLHQSGALSDDEFAAAKARLLG